MRAIFLSGMSRLHKKNIITIARYKSNHDYYYELKRRNHTKPKSIFAFYENVLIFEKVWYGDYGINKEILSEFMNKNELICE